MNRLRTAAAGLALLAGACAPATAQPEEVPTVRRSEVPASCDQAFNACATSSMIVLTGAPSPLT